MFKLAVLSLFAISLAHAYEDPFNGETQTFGGPLQFIESPYKIPVPKSCQGFANLFGKVQKNIYMMKFFLDDVTETKSCVDSILEKNGLPNNLINDVKKCMQGFDFIQIKN